MARTFVNSCKLKTRGLIFMIDSCEPFTKYNTESSPRVFYPAYLGEFLNDWYLVEQKLDFGGGSTVWMAHDRHVHVDVVQNYGIRKLGGNEVRI
ncbi:hypothetical protein N7490_011506 [Penicillium lividum]|nr:hypothetical protein N7490_011506 [Penicillium lividum]